tara:strand:- start:79516 stop:80007 length:492 start_codon:yes stop_codon:yes gene_type:complete
MKTNKPGLRQDTGLCSISDFRFFRDAACVTQTIQQQKVTTQPVGLELVQEPLLSERQERTVLPERRILEGTVPKLERHSSALLEHRLVHKPERTPMVHNMTEPSVHRPEHKLPERRSLVSRCNISPPERHTMASASTGQASAYEALAGPFSACKAWEDRASEV